MKIVTIGLSSVFLMFGLSSAWGKEVALQPLFNIDELEQFKTIYLQKCSKPEIFIDSSLQKIIKQMKQGKTISDEVALDFEHSTNLYDYHVGFMDCNFAEADLNIARAQRYLTVRKENEESIEGERDNANTMLAYAYIARYALNTESKPSDLEAGERLLAQMNILPQWDKPLEERYLDYMALITLAESYDGLSDSARNEAARASLHEKAKKIITFTKDAFEYQYAPIGILKGYKSSKEVTLPNGSSYGETERFYANQLMRVFDVLQ